MRSIVVRHALFLTALSASTFGCSAAQVDEPTSGTTEALGVARDLGGLTGIDTVVALNPAKDQSFVPAASWGRDLVGQHGWPRDVSIFARTFGDVNGDGKKDLVGFRDGGVYLSLSNGAHFDPALPLLGNSGMALEFGPSSHPRMLGDLNGDGRDDVVSFEDAGVYSALSTGTNFTAQGRLNAFGANQGWRVDTHVRMLADVDGDGRKDIVGFGENGVVLAISRPAGGFYFPSPVIPDACASKGWTPSRHIRTMADINGDGREDVVAFGDAGVWTALSTGTGFGTFRYVLATFGPSSAAGGWQVGVHPRVMADIDGDGKKDIVAFGIDGVWTARATGDGGFTPATYVLAAFGSGAGWDATTPRFVADVNHDGYADIVGISKDSAIYRSLGGPTGFAQPRRMMDAYVGDPASVTLADVDGNGMGDLVGFSYADTIVVRSTDAAPSTPQRPILEADMTNPTAPNMAPCGGKTFDDITGAKWEWTPMVPDHAGDQYGTDVAVSGTAIHPEQSEHDMPFSHPFYSEVDGNNYDFEYYVAPDPRYFSVLTDSNDPLKNGALPVEYTGAAIQAGTGGYFSPGVIGMEMDGAAVPAAYRAKDGDRVALFGRWIEDCGHPDFHKEIHPPLMQVVARQASPSSTTASIIGRPFLTSQEFGDGAFKEHMFHEVEKLATPIPFLGSFTVEAHSPILKPFTGVHFLSFVVRPPSRRLSPDDRLLLSFHFTLRSGVAVQAVDQGDDSIRVYVAMNETGYPFDVNKLFPGRKDWPIDVGSLDSDVKTAIEAITAGAIALLPPPVDINVAQALNRDFIADTYPTPHAVSPNDNVNSAVRVSSQAIPANIGYAIDNDQPFPIYGWMKVEWERHIIVRGGGDGTGLTTF